MNLTCEATLTSEVDADFLQITWDGPRIISSSNRVYSITQTNSNLTYFSSLNIENLEEDDEGEYTCTFENFDIGTFLNGSIFVDVQGKKGSLSIVYPN